MSDGSPKFCPDCQDNMEEAPGSVYAFIGRVYVFVSVIFTTMLLLKAIGYQLLRL